MLGRARHKINNMSAEISNIKPIEPVECPTLEKAQEHAIYIQIANQWLFKMDEEFLSKAARDTYDQAQRYDSCAVLNRQWNQYHSQVLNAKADALKHLAEYIKANKRVSELKIKEDGHNAAAEQISNLFT